MLSKDEIKIIGNQAVLAAFRVQLDGLLSVLDDSVRVKYQTVMFEKAQAVMETQKPLMNDEQFALFKQSFEGAIIRNER